jgi:hypothetical protein
MESEKEKIEKEFNQIGWPFLHKSLERKKKRAREFN